HLNKLESLLSIARKLGFTAPIEGAVHIHFDATVLMSAPVLAKLMRVLWIFGDSLKQLLESNPHCTRLGQWSQDLYDHIQRPEWAELSWEEARQSLAEFTLNKYCDFNIKNIIHPSADKQTFELRILPVLMHGERIIEIAALFEAILRWAIHSEKDQELPANLQEFLPELKLSPQLHDIWMHRYLTTK
ncbi:MAG: amidoligase family protein, partial [Mariprofundaceae bacterium]|nr:amidoligase family protein [Mariprofundaceae bacterium]